VLLDRLVHHLRLNRAKPHSRPKHHNAPEKTRADFTRLPRHVGIIMDGNGRWAKQHHYNVSLGHRQGTEALREIIRHTSHLGIEALTIYAFSTENWRRSPEEVAALMQLILEYFSSEIDELDAEHVRITIFGDKDGLPERQREVLIQAEERTMENTGLRLNICLNYGSRDEIAMACRTLARRVQRGVLMPESITPELLSDALYSAGQCDIDLMIRTSGEMRLSNFMLWQCAYAEFLFPKTLWPDFDVACYDEALASFGNRDRRFGGRK